MLDAMQRESRIMQLNAEAISSELTTAVQDTADASGGWPYYHGKSGWLEPWADEEATAARRHRDCAAGRPEGPSVT